MTEHQKSDEARKGLVDSIKGKAKEVVGAVTKNDSLTAEGQLDQVQAQERKEANSVEAIADAEAEQARADVTEARLEGAKERIEVNAEAQAVEDAVKSEQTAQKIAGVQASHEQAAREKTQAEIDAQRRIQHAKAAEHEEVGGAADDVVDAILDQKAANQAAASAKEEADRIRRQAENMTRQADLP